LRDPTFSRFDTILECGRQTDRHTDRHTTTAYTALSIASRGRKLVINVDLEVFNAWYSFGGPNKTVPFIKYFTGSHDYYRATLC